MNAAEFSNLLSPPGRHRRSSKWWDGRCPAHDDRRSSLSFCDGPRGLIVKCHVGCPPADIASRVGLDVRDLSDAPSRPRAPIATYDYTDARGTVLYQIVRFEPKDFRQRRPDGNGGFVWNMTDVRRVPYRLVDLAEQTRVFIPEGEKDCDALWDLGIAATTNEGGAGKWREEHTAALVAAAIEEVVVLPDNDAPGEQHAQSVATTCHAAGLRTKILRLPNLPSKGDVSDWLAAGHTRAELLALADAASVDGAQPAPSDTPDGRHAVVISAAAVTPETIQWLWPGRIAVGALTNIVGLPDQGKTLLFCDITGRLTTGAPMPPTPRARVRDPQRVLILTLEDSLAATIVPRLTKAEADLDMVDFVRLVKNADGSTSLLTLAEDLDVLAKKLDTHRYGLLVVDGIMNYLGRDAKTHNDADVRRVLTPFTELLDRTHVAGLSVMHPPKTVSNLAYYAGGSVAFTSVPRVALGVAPDPEDDNESPRRLLMKIKGNLYGSVPTLAFHIRSDGPADVPWLEWDIEPVRVNVADVLDPIKETPEDRGTRRACQDWLRSFLADGPRAAKDVEEAAKAAGFKGRTIERAKSGLVDSVKRGLGGWEWLLKARTP